MTLAPKPRPGSGPGPLSASPSSGPSAGPTAPALSRAASAVAVAVLLGGLLTGCTRSGTELGEPVSPSAGTSAASSSPRVDPATDPALSRFYRQELHWSDCDGFQCTKVLVPVDWAKPAGETLELNTIRSRATGPRVGTLLVNPGGPGVAGVRWLRGSVSGFGSAVRASYDLLSWDPRGVGESRPIRCLPNDRLDAMFAVDATPDDATELAAAVKENQDFAKGCETNTGTLLPHVDTGSTIRDMDVIRAAVGDQVISYFGASYGTYLGARYAQQFPWRVGRMVLDGAVDPSLDAAGYMEGQALGFSRGVKAYVDHCLQTSGCPLRGSREEAYQQLSALVDRADEQPLHTTSGRELTQSLLGTALAQGMYLQAFWPTVTKGITEALHGDGTTLLAMADEYNERDAKGVYGQTLQATGPIFCLDHPENRTVAQIGKVAAEFATRYPPLGDFIGWQALGCAEWPLKSTTTPARTTAAGAAPILVVGSTNDPATPYEWAKALASQLSSGRLLTRRGDGHTAYFQGNGCIDLAVDTYLVRGTLPAEGTSCS